MSAVAWRSVNGGMSIIIIATTIAGIAIDDAGRDPPFPGRALVLRHRRDAEFLGIGRDRGALYVG